MRVFVQANTSGEESKSGCAPGDVIALCKFIRDSCPALELAGYVYLRFRLLFFLIPDPRLMTIGRPGSVEDFVALAELRVRVTKELQLPLNSLELSMGMSGDFATAITYGSTNVRVGSKIFGDRQ